MKDKFKEGDVVVVLFHDHGSRYVGKMFNDDWMRDRGFLDEGFKNAREMVEANEESGLVSCGSEELVSHAVAKIKAHNISQIPITKDGEFVGYVDETRLYQQLIEKEIEMDTPLSKVMQPALPVVDASAKIEEVSSKVNKQVPAVIVDLGNGKYHIITRHDLISALA